MKQITFNPTRYQRPTTKAKVEHQDLMGQVIDAGYAPKKYQPRWGKWLKDSNINLIDLKRLIGVAKKLPKNYSQAGFIRNRLINKDWVKYF